MAKQPVSRPSQIGDLGDKLRLDPVDAGEDERRAEARLARRRDAQRRRLAGQRVEAAPQIGENLDGHSRAHAAGIDELAVVGVVAKQQRAEIRPRSFRVRPADDNELLAVQRFGFAPQATISRRVRRVDRLRDDALKTELSGVLEDELAVARFMAVELKPGLVCEQRLKQFLALDKRKRGNIPTVDMQEVEGIVDEPRAALAVGRGLRLGEARRPGVVNAAEFAVDIGGLHPHVGERRNPNSLAPSHIWLGVSVEDAKNAVRIKHLKAARASVKFVSFEPLIGSVGRINLSGIDWAIVGGESGPRARPMEEAWAPELRDQCHVQNVAFFFKQWGGIRPKSGGRKQNGRSGINIPNLSLRSPSRPSSMVALADYAGREQSYVKHVFLEDYLERLVRKTASTFSDIVYIDGYAGPWQSASERFEDTSFGIALTALRRAKESWKQIGRNVRMSAHLVERDATAYAKLKEASQRFSDVSVSTYSGDFVGLIPNIIKLIPSNAFAFFLIDPKGWRIPLQQLAPLAAASARGRAWAMPDGRRRSCRRGHKGHTAYGHPRYFCAVASKGRRCSWGGTGRPAGRRPQTSHQAIARRAYRTRGASVEHLGKIAKATDRYGSGRAASSLSDTFQHPSGRRKRQGQRLLSAVLRGRIFPVPAYSPAFYP